MRTAREASPQGRARFRQSKKEWTMNFGEQKERDSGVVKECPWGKKRDCIESIEVRARRENEGRLQVLDSLKGRHRGGEVRSVFAYSR